MPLLFVLLSSIYEWCLLQGMRALCSGYGCLLIHENQVTGARRLSLSNLASTLESGLVYHLVYSRRTDGWRRQRMVLSRLRCYEVSCAPPPMRLPHRQIWAENFGSSRQPDAPVANLCTRLQPWTPGVSRWWNWRNAIARIETEASLTSHRGGGWVRVRLLPTRQARWRLAWPT